mgnify:FL=1
MVLRRHAVVVTELEAAFRVAHGPLDLDRQLDINMQGRLADPAHGIVICKVVPHERHAGRRERRRVGGLAVLRRLCKSTIETRAVFLGDGAAVLARSRGERTGVPSKAPQTLICALFLARRCWLTIIDIAPPTQLSFASGVSVGVQACLAASRKL